MFEMLGFCILLAAVLTLNTITSSLAALIWHKLARRTTNWPPALRARLLFTLRVAPAMISLLLALTLVLPAYLLNEPRHKVEPVSYQLGILSVISAIALCLAVWRGLNARSATKRLVQNWLQASTQIAIPDLTIPAFRFPHQLPILAIIGFWRPKLFVSERLLQTLSPAELAATIAHEKGHLIAKDNLKRVAVRMCCDVLSILPSGRSLDRAWIEATEAAADDYAAHQNQNMAVELASALIKIARLIPAGERITLPVGAALIGQDEPGVAFRVQALLAFDRRLNTTCNAQKALFSFLYWCPVFGVALLALLLLSYPALLSNVHEITEFVVSQLR